ncbi:AbfB domain-containing protein [Streptomyces sp. NPDC001933]|uniref:AbfB domain-containing protein n=1 Tax=Streptomyces sp. NPDC001933 TaxID=3364626 RepID=UPI00367B3B03
MRGFHPRAPPPVPTNPRLTHAPCPHDARRVHDGQRLRNDSGHGPNERHEQPQNGSVSCGKSYVASSDPGGQKPFRHEATFVIVPGPADRTWISFRSYNAPTCTCATRTRTCTCTTSRTARVDRTRRSGSSPGSRNGSGPPAASQ